MTFIRICACWMPQYSAHWPQYWPGSSAVNQILFSWFGIASILPISCGIQKLWITLSDEMLR